MITAIDAIAREATLFAAIWFLVGGIDDLLVDLIYGGRWFNLRFRPRASPEPAPVADGDGRIVIFVAAWDEACVIGQMLRAALARFEHDDYRIYVGTYPNDPATIAAVAAVAGQDARVRLVIGEVPGPTTKAGCLNTLWRTLVHDEAAEGFATLGIALHDAEDIVHPRELAVYAAWLRHCATVQLPVLPLPHPRSRFVAGHYCDEFAEQHAKTLVVRQALGAGLPLAGVGCAIRRDVLGGIADQRGGAPFDATSLTEDYELGLTISAMGGKVCLARVPEAPGGPPVAVRAWFPDSFDAAVRQKARWLTGIALAGWDRTGWRATLNPGDHWMRMRDRRATLALPVLAIAYATLLLWGASALLHLVADTPAAALDPRVQLLLWANFALLGWRLLVRAAFVRHAYGNREALWSVPRVLVGNAVALFAARRAIGLYARILLGAAPRWEKTAHEFPDLAGSDRCGQAAP
nr:glycosyl transferase family protein [Sphingomonas naasensis]